MGVMYDVYVVRKSGHRLNREALVALCEDLIYERILALPAVVRTANTGERLPDIAVDPDLDPECRDIYAFRPGSCGGQVIYLGSSDVDLFEAVTTGSDSPALQVVFSGLDVRRPWNSGEENYRETSKKKKWPTLLECSVALFSFSEPQMLTAHHDAYITEEDIAELGLGEEDLYESVEGVTDYLQLAGSAVPEPELLRRSRLGEVLARHYGQFDILVTEM